jgi:1,4-dihydroxy-2-naphthoate octaprenyltransferase
VTQAGLLSPRAVALGAAACFGGAAVVGLYLTAVGGLPILVLGVAAIASGVLYTAGPWPLAYVGLGDLFVLAFFGIGAVVGTYYVQVHALDAVALWLGVAIGVLSMAILNVNNLRDIDGDRAAGKRTLAVRMGAAATRRYLTAMVAVAFVVPLALTAGGGLPWSCLLVLLAVPAGARLVSAVRSGVAGRALGPWLGATARLQLLYAALLCVGLAMGRLLAAAPPGG